MSVVVDQDAVGRALEIFILLGSKRPEEGRETKEAEEQGGRDQKQQVSAVSTLGTD